MGLDNEVGRVYHKNMKIVKLIKSLVKKQSSHNEEANHLVEFAQQEFKQLAKKNIYIPVTLYHL
jgi:hypothetical protein